LELTSIEQRRATSIWLRTGYCPVFTTADGIERKFNPYHDSRNGRFTFAPGGGGGTWRSARLAPGQRSVPPGRGSNSRAFEDPMTLEHVAPGLRNSPAGAIVAIADNLFDVHGPADAMRIEVIDRRATKALADIKALDPHFRYDELGPVTTVQGRQNRLDDILMQRAAVYARVKGDYGPLQVETIKVVQRETADAYARGQELVRKGKLTHGATDRMKLGNYIDREVRRTVRNHFNQYGIKVENRGQVRVNRREISSGAGSYSIPDIRVGRVVIDVSLQAKTSKQSQIGRFFSSDFKPNYVVIVRPRQDSAGHSYVIKR